MVALPPPLSLVGISSNTCLSPNSMVVAVAESLGLAPVPSISGCRGGVGRLRGRRFGRRRRRCPEHRLDLESIPGSDELATTALGGGGRGTGGSEVMLLLGWGSAVEGEAQGGRLHNRRHPRARLRRESVRR
jgi:hypothetical protein